LDPQANSFVKVSVIRFFSTSNFFGWRAVSFCPTFSRLCFFSITLVHAYSPAALCPRRDPPPGSIGRRRWLHPDNCFTADLRWFKAYWHHQKYSKWNTTVQRFSLLCQSGWCSRIGQPVIVAPLWRWLRPDKFVRKLTSPTGPTCPGRIIPRTLGTVGEVEARKMLPRIAMTFTNTDTSLNGAAPPVTVNI